MGVFLSFRRAPLCFVGFCFFSCRLFVWFVIITIISSNSRYSNISVGGFNPRGVLDNAVVSGVFLSIPPGLAFVFIAACIPTARRFALVICVYLVGDKLLGVTTKHCVQYSM